MEVYRAGVGAAHQSRRNVVRGACATLLTAYSAASFGAGPTTTVESFRTGGADDRDVVSAAIAAWVKTGGTLLFGANRVYDLGSINPPDALLKLEDFNGGVIDGRGARLICRTTSLGKTQMFLLRRCNNLTIRNLTACDYGTDLNVNWQGMDFIHADGSGGPQTSLTIENVTVSSACSYLTVSGPSEGRTRGITIRNGQAILCYYGLNFQENGDNVVADLRLENCRRAYYPYGVNNHDVTLSISHGPNEPSANACILVARGLRDTKNLRIFGRFYGWLPWTALVRLEHKSPLIEGGLIEDVDITILVDPKSRVIRTPAAFILSASNNELRPQTTPGIWRNIILRGSLGPLVANPVIVEARSTKKATVRFIELDTGERREINAN